MTAKLYFQYIAQATGETLLMVFLSTLFSALVGIPLGVLAAYTDKNGVRPNRFVHALCECVVGLGRSIPFIILLVLLLPVTRFLVGTAIGTRGAVVPLTAAAVPFVARVTDSALKETDSGVLEACRAMGASARHIVFKALIGESLPALIRGVGLTAVTLVGYSAMAGAVGGGGLGQLAYAYGYARYDTVMVLLTVVVLVVLVWLLQWSFNLLAKKIDKKSR